MVIIHRDTTAFSHITGDGSLQSDLRGYEGPINADGSDSNTFA